MNVICPNSLRDYYRIIAPRYADQTVEQWTASLNSLARFAGDQVVDDGMIERWASHLKEHSLNSTVTRRLDHAFKFFEWLVAGKLWTPPLPARPTLRHEESRPRIPMTQQEYDLILAQAEGEMRTFFMVGWHTGLRLSDAVNLRWKHIDLEQKVIRIVSIKTGKRLEIPFGSTLLAEFERVKSVAQFVMPGLAEDWSRWAHKVITTKVRRFLDKLRIDKSYHCVRHAFITRYLDAGVQAHTLAGVTGQTLATMSHYAHATLESKRAALKLD